jgi:hypothetical protein
MRVATPPASLPPSLRPPPPPPVTEQSPQPRQKPKPPAVLPLRRGKLQFIDLFVVLGYDGLPVFFIFLLGYFSLGGVAIPLFAALVLLVGPLLGSMRGALATLLFSIGWIIVLSLSGGGMIYSYPQNIWIPVSWIAVTFVIGWIYEKRKTRNFVLSWGILTLEAAILLLMVVSSLNSKTQISDVIGGLVVIIIVSSFIGVITAAIEALIQAIVVFIHKKKRRA